MTKLRLILLQCPHSSNILTQSTSFQLFSIGIQRNCHFDCDEDIWNLCSLFTFMVQDLTHWGRVTHICVSKLTIIGSVNGLSPGRRQAIIWTNDGIVLIWPLGTNFNEISIEVHTFSIKKDAFENIVWKMAAILSRPQCVTFPCSATPVCFTIGYCGRDLNIFRTEHAIGKFML